MSINATIIGQFITFAILIWFTMRYVWPPIINHLNEREKKIAAGLEAAEKSKQELAAAEMQASFIVQEARQQASHLLEQAHFHSAQLIEEAKTQAKIEGVRILELAQSEMAKEATKAREALKKQVIGLAVLSAEKILQQHLDASTHQDILKQVIAGL
jgi:F-type H+-transporting ATPase subunit b